MKKLFILLVICALMTSCISISITTTKKPEDKQSVDFDSININYNQPWKRNS